MFYCSTFLDSPLNRCVTSFQRNQASSPRVALKRYSCAEFRRRYAVLACSNMDSCTWDKPSVRFSGLLAATHGRTEDTGGPKL